MSHGH
jgi:V-type H+-transporting ATPase subunit B